MSYARRSFSFTEEPRGRAYRVLLEHGLRQSTHASLVQRRDCALDAGAKAVLRDLTPSLRLQREVSGWSGTRLVAGTALLREYHLSEATVRVLSSAVDGLYDWCQPSRPEDLVLWRGDGDPWLVAVAHERDAYLWGTRPELTDLLREHPELRPLLPV